MLVLLMGLLRVLGIVFALFSIGFILLRFRNMLRPAQVKKSDSGAPILSVSAMVKQKRAENKAGRSAGAASSFTCDYYVVFEVESGDRLEFVVGAVPYASMYENQSGKLTFQGKSFLSFQ